MAPYDAEPEAGAAPVRLGEAIEILPGSPAPEFCSSDAEAFLARERDQPEPTLCAVICTPGVPPRLPLIELLSASAANSFLRPLHAGVIDWPPRGRRCFAIVFERMASRVVAAPGGRFAPLPDEEIVADILPPLMAALKVIHDLGHTHRGVRPDNLFRRAGEPGVVLGDCVSGPPAAAQPVAYEPIESGLAMPSGRGMGTPADDLYALGATILCLLLGHEPGDGRPEAELLADKIQRGSFVALTSGAKPLAKMIEPMRGLLADDPRERWTLLDLESWMKKRVVAPKQLPPPRRAARPLPMGEAEYWSARPLAQAMTQDTAAAMKAIRSGALDAWLQRSLGDPDRSAAVTAAIGDGAEADNAAREARLVARLALALDPAAPVRYMDLAAAIDGFGSALAASFRAGGNSTAISDAIMARLPQYAIALQGGQRQHAPLLKIFDRMRMLLEDRRMGFGLARVLYELNPGLHCLSPAIEAAHVIEAGDLLPALERAAAAGRLADTIIDRHVAAFIGARCKGAGVDWHDEIAGAGPGGTLGVLRLLAHLQRLGGAKAAPALGERMAQGLPAVIARYRSLARRTRLAAALGRLSGKGRFAEMLALVANPAEQQRDDEEYRGACAAYAGIERALAVLRASDGVQREQAAELGCWLALAASGVLAAAALACGPLLGAG